MRIAVILERCTGVASTDCVVCGVTLALLDPQHQLIMTTTYHIEKAKSARSKCKKCKETIVKDDMRIGSSSERDDRVMTS